MPRSILFLARFAPSKRPEVLLDALGILKERNVSFSASFYGSPLVGDGAFLEREQEHMRQLGLSDSVKFYAGVSNAETPPIYRAHELFVNCSKSGMYDKTIFEAAACGCLVLAASADYSTIGDPRLSFDGSADNLAQKLQALLALSPQEKAALQKQGMMLAEGHSLETLGRRLLREMQ